nr:MAG TPA: hypothetical protein [Caudoviricetes sp.]
MPVIVPYQKQRLDFAIPLCQEYAIFDNNLQKSLNNFSKY